MPKKYNKQESKQRILSVCVKLFIEKGYHKTTLAEILSQSGTTSSTFQNIFRSKDGVLLDLTEFMFENQFAAARTAVRSKLPPAYIYAVETAIQLTLTELNENLREIYIAAYTHREASLYIYKQTAKEIYRIFGAYQPELSEQDFYSLEIGTAGTMYTYMAYPCNEYITLEKKIESFLSISLSAYRVPKQEQKEQPHKHNC